MNLFKWFCTLNRTEKFRQSICISKWIEVDSVWVWTHVECGKNRHIIGHVDIVAVKSKQMQYLSGRNIFTRSNQICEQYCR